MKKCYLDNASTTQTKPASVYQAVNDTMQHNGCSPSRGGYGCAIEAGRKILDARSALARLFNVADSRYIVFTPGITWSINMVLLGLLKEGDHVITTSMEHNAVTRPLRCLEQEKQIEVSWVKANALGQIDPGQIEQEIRAKTRLILVNHASNIIGTILPLAEIAEISRRNKVLLMADCAQTAGYCDLDFQNLGLDILAFTGHKALYGPPGTGGMILSERAAREIKPVIQGGTGSSSASQLQPEMMPEKFESGTHNTPGIAGLGAGVKFVLDIGLENIRRHEQALLEQLVAGLREIPFVTIYYSGNTEEQVPTISITIENLDMGEASILLDERYGIMTRSGIHCAPISHQTIGTFPLGTIRLSIGYFNTPADISYTVQAITELAKEYNK